ncbi:hypothetical protein M2401_004050 [Pseudomonas sp. JUb42]|jgi:hypothetical protein|nr:hypothetical protein [Pseudomonas sp. JUb42]
MYNSGPRRSRQAIKLHLYNGHFKGYLSSSCVMTDPPTPNAPQVGAAEGCEWI